MNIAEGFLRILAVTAHQSYLMSLGGNPSAYQRRAYAFMTNPQVGSCVVEISTIHRRTVPERNCIGYLCRIAREPVGSTDEWRTIDPTFDERETVWYIRDFAGVEHRWTNAQFIALYTEIPY